MCNDENLTVGNSRWWFCNKFVHKDNFRGLEILIFLVKIILENCFFFQIFMTCFSHFFMRLQMFILRMVLLQTHLAREKCVLWTWKLNFEEKNVKRKEKLCKKVTFVMLDSGVYLEVRSFSTSQLLKEHLKCNKI